jgi:formate hydrogenlyase transcriptional activator
VVSLEVLVAEERRLIETALAETLGRVAGPYGAATKLGMPPSTLESKIKSLHIDKRRFRPVSQNRQFLPSEV